MSPTCSCLALRRRVLSLALPVWRVGRVRQHVGVGPGSGEFPPFQIMNARASLADLSVWLPQHTTACLQGLPFSGWVQPSFLSQRLQCLLSFLLPTQNFGACCPPGAYVKEKRPPGQLLLIMAWHECCGMAGCLLAPIPSCFFMEKIIPGSFPFSLPFLL